MKARDLYFEDIQMIMASGCEKPGCTHADHPVLIFQARCHPGHGLIVELVRGEDWVSIRCGICGEQVARLFLARREPGTASFPA